MRPHDVPLLFKVEIEGYMKEMQNQPCNPLLFTLHQFSVFYTTLAFFPLLPVHSFNGLYYLLVHDFIDKLVAMN